jgi:uncharacterized repeat protein (TIGR03837 family)
MIFLDTVLFMRPHRAVNDNTRVLKQFYSAVTAQTEADRVSTSVNQCNACGSILMYSKNINSCDIFCTVVDNYGDIGVCWRLAKQLASEHGIVVRLWVDDLASLRKLCPDIDPTRPIQQHRGVEIRHWGIPFAEIAPAQLVIEAFACELPERYVLAMASQALKPVWLNLEYLSAEYWVAGCHGLPSPHPRLPLVKYFFFPGFTRETGGLLLEGDLLRRRDAFLADAAAQEKYWQSLGVPARQAGEVRVSLFSYENPAVQNLLASWAAGEQALTCLVPEGRVLPQVASFFGRQQLAAGDVVQHGRLRVHVLPFVEQDEYDKLLWACDCNFVRGEDSCVRAQWAEKPFIWHIYVQHDGVHMKKMRALLDLYCTGLEPGSAGALRALWELWNAGDAACPDVLESSAQVWNDFLNHQSMLRQHASVWAQRLEGNNLALNLLDFSLKVGRIAPFEI